MVAEALSHVDRDRALTTVADAERAALGASPGTRPRALAMVAKALARIGQWDRAEQLARSVTSPNDQAWAYAAIAATLTVASMRNGVGREVLRLRACHLLGDSGGRILATGNSSTRYGESLGSRGNRRSAS